MCVTAGWRDCWRETNGAPSDCDALRLNVFAWWTENPGETTSGGWLPPDAKESTTRLLFACEMWICWDCVDWLGAAVGTRDRWVAAVSRDCGCAEFEAEAEAEPVWEAGKEASWVANCDANWAELVWGGWDTTAAVARLEIGTWLSSVNFCIWEWVIDGTLDIVPAKDVARESWVLMGTFWDAVRDRADDWLVENDADCWINAAGKALTTELIEFELETGIWWEPDEDAWFTDPDDDNGMDDWTGTYCLAAFDAKPDVVKDDDAWAGLELR